MKLRSACTLVALTLATNLSAQTPAPESGSTPEWSFINFSEVMTPRKLTLECEFRDVAGQKFVVSLKQYGDIVYVIGGFATWSESNNSSRLGYLPVQTLIVRDDTKLFRDSKLPRLDEGQPSAVTLDGEHSFRLLLGSGIGGASNALPATVEVFQQPPGPAAVAQRGEPEPPPPPKPPERASSLAGFCKSESTFNTFTFEELDRLGREAK